MSILKIEEKIEEKIETMETVEIGYKLVYKKEENQLVSTFIRGKAEVVYSPYYFVFAPTWLLEQGYGLTYFDTINHTKRFMQKKFVRDEIWECKAIYSILRLPPRCSFIGLSAGLLEPSGLDWPKGTKMAKGIKLIKKILD